MPELFTTLDFSESRVRGFTCGLRPFRQGSPRLEVEISNGKVLAHNYGHGGSGITMAWGAAEEILRRLEPHTQPGDRPVAVLGAGILGLCTALLALEQGQDVTVYAKDLPPAPTTSSIAGGLWAPTHVGAGSSEEEHALHDRILRRSWQLFEKLDPLRYGVEKVPMFEADNRLYDLDPMPSGLTEPPRRLTRLPFSGPQPPGQVWDTLLIETPKFLRVLLDDILAKGGKVRELEFQGPKDLHALSEPIVINCLGLGAAKVACDPQMQPIRGQLVLLDPAPRPFVLDHSMGYIISRRDVLILGGTFEEGVSDMTPNDVTCREILDNTRRLFLDPEP